MQGKGTGTAHWGTTYSGLLCQVLPADCHLQVRLGNSSTLKTLKNKTFHIQHFFGVVSYGGQRFSIAIAADSEMRVEMFKVWEQQARWERAEREKIVTPNFKTDFHPSAWGRAGWSGAGVCNKSERVAMPGGA